MKPLLRRRRLRRNRDRAREYLRRYKFEICSKGRLYRRPFLYLKNIKSCHLERRGVRDSEILAVERPLPRSRLPAVGVLRPLESARTSPTHCAQDDRV